MTNVFVKKIDLGTIFWLLWDLQPCDIRRVFTDRITNVTDLLFYAYVEIHQVRILRFDNYQRCQVPLNT